MEVWGPFTRIEYQEMNLNSHTQVKDYFLSHGWVPTEWNYKCIPGTKRKIRDARGRWIKSSPKLTEDSFGTIEGEAPELLAQRNVLTHRSRMLYNITKKKEEKGWLNLVRPDGRLPADGIPQGTNTGRYRHSVIVNVPKAKEGILYGKEFRSLFVAKDGYKLMGADAKGLEARMEGHYCFSMPGGVEYATELLEGDIHTKNAVLFNTDREGAKSPKYCLTYGGYPPRLAETLGCSKAEGERYFNAFWDGNIALKTLRDRAEEAFEVRGFLIGLDGRKLYPRNTKDSINALFQSGGSIVVKTATIYLNKWISDFKLNAQQVLHQHDEFLFEFHPKDESRLLELTEKSFKEAGKYWNLNIPIEGDPKVGDSWGDVH